MALVIHLMIPLYFQELAQFPESGKPAERQGKYNIKHLTKQGKCAILYSKWAYDITVYDIQKLSELFCISYTYQERGTEMELELKTQSFGGYDKKAVENYIAEMQEDYEGQIAQLKETTQKLGETVDSLRKMREVNMNESKTTVENLKNTNTDLQEEVETLREKLAGFEEKQADYQAKYESVSKVALDAQMRADKLVRDTEAACEQKMAETTAEAAKLKAETSQWCEAQRAETTQWCESQRSETEAACARLTQ